MPLSASDVLVAEYRKVEEKEPAGWPTTCAFNEDQIIHRAGLVAQVLACPTDSLIATLNNLLESATEIKELRRRLNRPYMAVERWAEEDVRVRRTLLDDALHPYVKSIEDVRLAALNSAVHQDAQEGRPRSALCLSGGGIRSATFALGVLQGLARQRIFQRFAYLSTVSGGGYIGAWLSAWFRRDPYREEGVLHKLANPPEHVTDPEPEPIRHLRSYSNYLTPKLGLLSGDTWAVIGTYLRNVSLNQVVLVPLLMAVLLLPRLHAAFIGSAPFIPAERALLIAGLVLGSIAIAYIGLNLRVYHNDLKNNPFWWRHRGQNTFLVCSLLPLTLSALLLTTYGHWTRKVEHGFFTFMAFGALFHLIGGVLAFVELKGKKHWVAVFAMAGFTATTVFPSTTSMRGFLILGAVAALVSWLWKRENRDFLTLLAVLVSGLVAAAAIFWIAQECAAEEQTSLQPWSFAIMGALLSSVTYAVAVWRDNAQRMAVMAVTGAAGGSLLFALVPSIRRLGVEQYVCFAPSIFLFVFLVAATIFVGLLSKKTSDEDREWWARSGGWTLAVLILWAAVSALVVYGPQLVYEFPKVIAPIGGISGLVTLILGAARRTPANQKEKEEAGWKGIAANVSLSVAAPLFACFIVAILSLLTTSILQSVFPVSGTLRFQVTSNAHFASIREAHLAPVAGTMIALAALALLASSTIDVNTFSMHTMYRNRLMRAYLGASRVRQREENPFTGFDPADDLGMHELRGRKPMHVVNMALNLVGGSELAWQERKAASFTATPWHCGSAQIGYRDSEKYGGGMSLATAVAISGAAASPNMGYHSSPAVSFLLTLFNVRLGWWLGNPGIAGTSHGTYEKVTPALSVSAIVREAFGFTNDASPYVYLSDGGHFENLGLYEMVRRRCRYIVAIDAGQDNSFAFDDLGNAIRKIRIDFGIPIDVNRRFIYPRGKQAGKYCAIGVIGYRCVDQTPPAQDGFLLYIKPAFYGSEPVDVYNYGTLNEQFPHETTGDQFFSESQFESYRMLGSHIIDEICRESKAKDLHEFFELAKKYVNGGEKFPRRLRNAVTALLGKEGA